MSRFDKLEFGDQLEEEFGEQNVAKDEGYFLNQGRTAFGSADFEKALRAYAKALEFNPRSETGWGGQVRALIELGEYREAALWADKALEHFEAAQAIAEETGYRQPLAEAWLGLGLVQERKGDTSAALKYYEKALAIAQPIKLGPVIRIASSRIDDLFRLS